MLVPTRAAIVAVTALLALPLISAPAHAADADLAPSAATLRSQADAIATRYFDALARYQSLNREIAENKQIVDALAVRARRARSDAKAAALSAYRSSSAQLPTIVSSENALNAARRVRLIEHVNAHDQTIYRRLHTATKQLNSHRRALEADRERQADALAQLQAQSSDMEAKLALAQQQEQAAAAEQADREAAREAATEGTALAAAEQAASPAAVEPETTAPTTTAPTTTTVPPPKKEAPSPPPNYVGTPGTHPKHGDPFLSCVRARESGGNYGAVNPSGPYLGAYQFFQATWNGAANHAGRTALVGVPANLATAYDQDDLAWVLYQWQGAGPWGGSCP